MEKRTKKATGSKLVKSARMQPARSSVPVKKVIKRSTRAIDVASSRKPRKRFNRIIPSRLAVLIILLLAVMVGAYAFFASNYSDSLLTYFPGRQKVTRQEGGAAASAGGQCTGKKYEGSATLRAWLADKNIRNKKMFKMAVSKDDMGEIPFKSVVVKENKYFLVNILDPSNETIGLLQGASEANPASIEIKAYEDTCNDIPTVRTDSWTAWPTK